MTREEAIAILEESKRQNQVMRDNPTTFWASYQMTEGVENSKNRIAALDVALSALRGPTREMVERMRGEWGHPGYYDDEGCFVHDCSKCGAPSNDEYPFCHACGAPMTDEAVEMVIERMEALKDAVD